MRLTCVWQTSTAAVVGRLLADLFFRDVFAILYFSVLVWECISIFGNFCQDSEQKRWWYPVGAVLRNELRETL